MIIHANLLKLVNNFYILPEPYDEKLYCFNFSWKLTTVESMDKTNHYKPVAFVSFKR